MKKAAIIVCAAIYAMAIIIVAFLGYQAEIKNPPVYADEIVLVEKTPYNHIENGVIVYSITKNEELITRSESDEETSERFYKYEVQIMDFDYLYYMLNGELDVKAKPISYLMDEETGEAKVPDELGLNYTISSKRATVNNEGHIKISEFDDYGSFDLVIRTKDSSNITIYVRIYW